MTQTKISGKFYPLTSEVTAKLRQAKMTAAEWRIWSYLVEVEPWGDRYQDLDSLDVMSKCNCSRATFYRAIAKFQRLGLFDIQDKGFSIRNLTGASTLKSVDEKTDAQRLRKGYRKNETEFSKMRLNSQNCESSLKNETEFSKMRQNSQNCENQPPESPPDKTFKSPQTLQTYSDFKKTLSEDERDNFLDFVREQIHNLERPINDLEAWLASKNAANQNRWEVYYENYQKQGVEQKSRNSQKTSRQGNSTREKNSAIAEFRKRMSLNQAVNELETEPEEFNSIEPELETEPEATNSCRSQEQKTEFDELLDDSLGLQKKSPAQRRREQIAEARAKQQELKQKKQELADERAKQLDQDFEKRKAAMLQQAEEYKQFLQQQNSETDCEKSEIDPENPEIDAEDNKDA